MDTCDNQDDKLSISYDLQEAQVLFNLPFEASTDTEALDVQRQSSQ